MPPSLGGRHGNGARPRSSRRGSNGGTLSADMEKITYRQLVEQLGVPKTDRLVLGTLGYRIDTFPCGCMRIVRVGEIPLPVDDEGRIVIPIKVEFQPCEAHKAEFENVEVM